MSFAMITDFKLEKKTQGSWSLGSTIRMSWVDGFMMTGGGESFLEFSSRAPALNPDPLKLLSLTTEVHRDRKMQYGFFSCPFESFWRWLALRGAMLAASDVAPCPGKKKQTNLHLKIESI